jgi:hypothetical protein
MISTVMILHGDDSSATSFMVWSTPTSCRCVPYPCKVGDAIVKLSSDQCHSMCCYRRLPQNNLLMNPLGYQQQHATSKQRTPAIFGMVQLASIYPIDDGR